MKKFIFPLFLLLLTIFLTFSKIHPSSIGAYHQYFYGNKKDANLIFSQPRAIRSDEWLVGTPKIIGQVKAGFAVINKNIGYGEVMPVQGCLPYKHWRVIFCPNLFGFFFLPLEQAYALSWWFLNFLMILAVYFFLLYLSKSVFLSIFSSLIIFFTPFHQWWSYSLSSFLGYGLFFVLFFIKSLEKKGLKSFFYLILSSYFLTCFAFILYPPFQIATFYIFGSFIFGYLLSKKLFNKKAILNSLISVTLVGIIIFLFYFEFKETINIVSNTVYPGKRFVANTLGNLSFLINGFYNIQLLDDSKGAGPFGNQSEASNFFMLSMYVLPVYWWVIVNQIKNKKIDYIFLFLNISFLILLLWFLFPFPFFAAKLTLLYLVPQKRAIIGVGIASYLLMFYFLSRIKPKKDFYYLYLTLFSALMIFFVNLYLGFWLKFNFPVFIQNNLKIILISLFSSVLVFLLLSQKVKLFLILFLLFSILSSYRVNPLYRGLSPLLDTSLANEIRRIDKETGNKYRWVSYASIYLENYLIANGIKSLNGTYFYPQFSLWSKFDEDGKYKDIYNRYAHVTLFADKEKERFLLYYADHFGFNLDPCDDELKKLNIKFLIFENKATFSCIKLKKNVDNFYIYEVI